MVEGSGSGPIAGNPAPIRAGFGIVIAEESRLIGVDSSYVVTINGSPSNPAPVLGSGCEQGAGVRVLPGWLYACEPILPLSANPNPWGRWSRAKLENADLLARKAER